VLPTIDDRLSWRQRARWTVVPVAAAHRRPARDHEHEPAISEAMIRWAAINTITRRIARGGPATRQQRRLQPTKLIFSTRS